MKAICLVVVKGGIAYAYEPVHVDCRIVDLDNPLCDREELPQDVGFEELAGRAGLKAGIDYIPQK